MHLDYCSIWSATKRFWFFLNRQNLLAKIDKTRITRYEKIGAGTFGNHFDSVYSMICEKKISFPHLQGNVYRGEFLDENQSTCVAIKVCFEYCIGEG
jgi:hypothetical protein